MITVDEVLDKTLQFSGLQFLPNMSFGNYLEFCKRHHPALYEMIDVSRYDQADLEATFAYLNSIETEFRDTSKGGRGDTYRRTQIQFPLMRSTGIRSLLDLAAPASEIDPHDMRAIRVLDVIGGNGTLTRAAQFLREDHSRPSIITSDISSEMISDALSQGLPAIREHTTNLLFGDKRFDAVIFAYGTHHIPDAERVLAFREALRILKPSKRIIVQDFETGTPTARWYSQVINDYTITGHKHNHFSRCELGSMLVDAGFVDVEVFEVYDPCIITRKTYDQARRDILGYLVNLFGLVKFASLNRPDSKAYWNAVEEVVFNCLNFDSQPPRDITIPVTKLTVTKEGNGFRAELPRVALVATGRRPFAS